MKRWLTSVVTLVLLLVGGWWLSREEVVEETPSVAWVNDPTDEQLKLQRNKTEVFQRAFWRRPSDQEQIVNAERRHWFGGADESVERWQWFIEVKPGADFQDWLLNENPFDLVIQAAQSPLPDASASPDWMPPAQSLAHFVHYRKRGGNFHVFLDPKTQRLYATDSGGGFTIAQK